MLHPDDLLFSDNEALIAELRDCAEAANAEAAHEQGDEILVLLLLRAANGEVLAGEAALAVEAYESISRRFG